MGETLRRTNHSIPLAQLDRGQLSRAKKLHLHKPRHCHIWYPLSRFITMSFRLSAFRYTTRPPKQLKSTLVCVTLEPNYNCSLVRIRLCQVYVRALLPSVPIMHKGTSQFRHGCSFVGVMSCIDPLPMRTRDPI